MAWLLPRGVTVIVTFALAAIALLAAMARRIDLRWIATRIEATFPELQTKLLAAYEKERSSAPGQRGFLEEEVIQQARIHALTHRRWNETVPTRELRTWSAVQAFALMLLVTTIWLH